MKAITELRILAIEVTQAIQFLDPTTGYQQPDNSIELDADKDTVIRVYIGHDGSAPELDPFAPSLKAVTVKICWLATHQPIYGGLLSSEMSQSFDVPWTTDLNELRDDRRGSATFIVPAAQLGKPGWRKVLYVDAYVTAPPGYNQIKTQNNSKSIVLGETDAAGNIISGGLVPHKPLDVVWYPIMYLPSGAHIAQYPDMQEIGKADSLIARCYPMRINYHWGGAILRYGPSRPRLSVDGGASALSLMTLAFALYKPQPDAVVGCQRWSRIPQNC